MPLRLKIAVAITFVVGMFLGAQGSVLFDQVRSACGLG